jgi:L-alanine-DL-glutamate epimerase-like enolase superfamily enzyme
VSVSPTPTRFTASKSGVSIGIQDSLEELADRVELELAAGYRRIKIKIKPGWDLDAPEIEVRADGTIAVPSGSGIGVAVVSDRVHAATIESLELRPI